jgi:hypothetical protein
MSATLMPAHHRSASGEAGDRRRSPVTSILALVLVGVVAVLGAWRLPAVLFPRAAGPQALPQVSTSFGVVTVTGHELLDGPSPEELGGVTHGIGGYVDSQHALMRVHLQLTGNDSDVAATAFSLALPDGTRLTPEMNTLPNGTLPSGVNVDTSLSFVLPRGSGDYALQVSDGSTSTSVPLGQVTAVPRPSAHNH